MDSLFQVEKIQRAMELREDELEQYVRDKFKELNTLFLKGSKDVEDFVIRTIPKKSVVPSEIDDENHKHL